MCFSVLKRQKGTLWSAADSATLVILTTMSPAPRQIWADRRSGKADGTMDELVNLTTHYLTRLSYWDG